jgi:hypothetical protein
MTLKQLKIGYAVVGLVLSLLFAFSSGGFTSEGDTVKTLTSSSYTDVKTWGYAWMACGEDRFATKFVVKNQQGQQVSGAVCCGFIKSCTVRF